MKKLPEYLVLAADGSYVDIKLTRAIEADGAKITALRMREPTVADQEVAVDSAGSDASREIMMFANLSEVTPDQIRKMALKDYKRLQEAFINFTA